MHSDLISECKFKAVKSSGSGGQNVNKVATKVELQFDVMQSKMLSEALKSRLLKKWSSKLTKQGVLILQCGASRSQLKNKSIVSQRFLTLVTQALKVKKKRIPTKTPKSVIRKRLKSKKHKSEKKANRKKPDID
jgi:ribosome-associated protein